ncbi:MAG: hypothetical protein ACE5NJ_04015 [Thermodesulfobacteriota bacterium]
MKNWSGSFSASTIPLKSNFPLHSYLPLSKVGPTVSSGFTGTSSILYRLSVLFGVNGQYHVTAIDPAELVGKYYQKLEAPKGKEIRLLEKPANNFQQLPNLRAIGDLVKY